LADGAGCTVQYCSLTPRSTRYDTLVLDNSETQNVHSHPGGDPLSLLYLWAAQNSCMAPAQRPCAGFRKFSKKIFMHRARRGRAGLTVYPPSRTLELLAFDEYCRFDTSAFFWRIKRASTILLLSKVQYVRSTERAGIDLRYVSTTRFHFPCENLLSEHQEFIINSM
jgi:hypothetical protein